MKTDQAFIDAFIRSQASVAKVASWMSQLGYDVAIKPSVLRPDAAERMQYADGGDIEMRQRVEVKHRTIPFTCADDYPFGTVIVDEVYKVDRVLAASSWGYVILNNAGTHACLINRSTKPLWLISKLNDSRESEPRKFYVAPVSVCKFHAIEGN